jgi:hypothetical protein
MRLSHQTWGLGLRESAQQPEQAAEQAKRRGGEQRGKGSQGHARHLNTFSVCVSVCCVRSAGKGRHTALSSQTRQRELSSTARRQMGTQSQRQTGRARERETNWGRAWSACQRQSVHPLLPQRWARAPASGLSPQSEPSFSGSCCSCRRLSRQTAHPSWPLHSHMCLRV